MKILLTGGLGFVGQNLLRLMKEKGFEMGEITVIDKAPVVDFSQRTSVKFICADLSISGDWSKLFRDQEMIILLHAQISSPASADFDRHNVEATKRVITAAKKYGVKKIIYFSSAAVLSSRKDNYAQTKQLGEEIVKSSSLNYVIIQPSIIYGPGDNKNIGWLINFAKKCPVFPVPGHGRYPRQPIYIDDLCQLVIKLIHNFPLENKVYSINGKEKIYFHEMVRIVLKELKGIHFMIYLPIPVFLFLMRLYDFLFHSPFTPGQIKSLTSGDVFPDYPWWDEFGIRVTSFAEGIKSMIQQQ